MCVATVKGKIANCVGMGECVVKIKRKGASRNLCLKGCEK
jgi:hypothetical protein